MGKPHVDLPVQVWYSKNDGTIHISSNDRRLTDEDGNYKGLNIAISAGSKPKTFRWLDLLLRREGVDMTPAKPPSPPSPAE